MSRKMRKHLPPSRIKYEERNPTVSCRVSQDVYDQLTAAKEAHGQSFADFLRSGMERQELYDKSVGEARKRGWDEGREAGFTKGQKEGWNQGYEKGAAKARSESWREGHEKGFAEGRARGLQEGYNQGFDSAKVQYRIGYQCDDCGLWIWAEQIPDKLDIKTYMKAKHLGHPVCPRRRS